MKKKILFIMIFALFPWALRRWILQKFLGYEIHRTASISRFSLIVPNHLVMEAHSKIAAFSVAIHLEKLVMKESSSIGRSNWISGYPQGSKLHFVHAIDRKACLIIGEQSAITKKHIIDCTDTISIGRYTTIAGYQSQFLTHSIDYSESRQDCSPINIGDYCIVGTGSIFLPGSSLPDYSICGAGTIMGRSFSEIYALYAGAPAVLKKNLDPKAKYFLRKRGYVD
jgi:acetyltransferase-like isoleucine patch superfamily enzyme